MADVYIDSTLHNDWNAKFNPELCEAQEAKGITCQLPQRDTNQQVEPEGKFNQNIEGIKNANILLAVASNESPNWGVEVGFAHGIGKNIVALATTEHAIPLMGKYMIADVVSVEDLDDIPSYIDTLVATIKTHI